MRFDYMAQVLSLARDSAPLFINKMNEAIIRKASNKNNIVITVVNEPLALPPAVAKIENAIDGIVSAFIFAIGLSFIPASLITFSVK